MLRIIKQSQLVPAVLLAIAPLAQALPTDRDQPVKVSADSASFDQKAGVAIYIGNVYIQQGTMQLHADRVTVTLDKDGALQKTVSVGKPAHYEQRTDLKRGVVTADAATIEFDQSEQKVVLSGGAHLRQDAASFQGSTITYLIDGQKVDAAGDQSQRVQLVLPPQVHPLMGKDKQP